MPGREGPEILSSPLPTDAPRRVDRYLARARGHCWAVVFAVGLVGAAVGALGMRLGTHPPVRAAAAPSTDLRVSLGAGAGGPPTVVQGRAVVEVPLVLTNAASTTVSLASIRVSGPGAALTTDPHGPAQPGPTAAAGAGPALRRPVRSQLRLLGRRPAAATGDPGHPRRPRPHGRTFRSPSPTWTRSGARPCCPTRAADGGTQQRPGPSSGALLRTRRVPLRGRGEVAPR